MSHQNERGLAATSFLAALFADSRGRGGQRIESVCARCACARNVSAASIASSASMRRRWADMLDVSPLCEAMYLKLPASSSNARMAIHRARTAAMLVVSANPVTV